MATIGNSSQNSTWLIEANQMPEGIIGIINNSIFSLSAEQNNIITLNKYDIMQGRIDICVANNVSILTSNYTGTENIYVNFDISTQYGFYPTSSSIYSWPLYIYLQDLKSSSITESNKIYMYGSPIWKHVSYTIQQNASVTIGISSDIYMPLYFKITNFEINPITYNLSSPSQYDIANQLIINSDISLSNISNNITTDENTLKTLYNVAININYDTTDVSNFFSNITQTQDNLNIIYFNGILPNLNNSISNVESTFSLFENGLVEIINNGGNFVFNVVINGFTQINDNISTLDNLLTLTNSNINDQLIVDNMLVNLTDDFLNLENMTKQTITNINTNINNIINQNGIDINYNNLANFNELNTISTSVSTDASIMQQELFKQISRTINKPYRTGARFPRRHL
jgi:hypothetical protein